MDETLRRIRNPRCYLLFALAPEGLSAAEANRIFNELIADRRLPLAVFHDHFIGRPGGVAIFYVEGPGPRDQLLDQSRLAGWRIEIHPMIFSFSPSAFDAQIAFTLDQYRGQDWDQLRKEARPSYGNPAREAETAQEE